MSKLWRAVLRQVTAFKGKPAIVHDKKLIYVGNTGGMKKFGRQINRNTAQPVRQITNPEVVGLYNKLGNMSEYWARARKCERDFRKVPSYDAKRYKTWANQ